MATYLAAFFVATQASQPRALWWAHTLALLVFLPLSRTPSTCTCPQPGITIFLSRGSFSQIPPLVGDEDFGLVTGKDLTQLVSLQAYSCVECGRCTEHCPAANTGKVLNPKEIILGVRSYLNEYGTPKSRSSASTTRRKPPSNAPPAAPASSNARSASSICPSSSACAAAPPTPASGKTLRHQALPRAGAQRQRPRHERPAERDKFIRKATAHLRRHPGVLPLARLHGRLRPQGPRDHRRLRPKS
jgi:ferredoxin